MPWVRHIWNNVSNQKTKKLSKSIMVLSEKFRSVERHILTKDEILSVSKNIIIE